MGLWTVVAASLLLQTSVAPAPEPAWRVWRNGPMGVELQYPADWDRRVPRCGSDMLASRKHPLADDYTPADPDYPLFDFARPPDEQGRWANATVTYHPNAASPGADLVRRWERSASFEGADGAAVSEWTLPGNPAHVWVVQADRRRITISAYTSQGAEIEALRETARRCRLLTPAVQEDPATDGWQVWTTDAFVVEYPQEWDRVLPTGNETAMERRWDEIWTSTTDPLRGRRPWFGSPDPVVMTLRDFTDPRARWLQAADPAAAWLADRRRHTSVYDFDPSRTVSFEQSTNAHHQPVVRERFDSSKATVITYSYFAPDRVYQIEFFLTGRWRDSWLDRTDAIARRFRLLDPAPTAAPPAPPAPSPPPPPAPAPAPR